MKEPWIICPECGCGKGEDHKRGCSQKIPPPHRNYKDYPETGMPPEPKKDNEK